MHIGRRLSFRQLLLASCAFIADLPAQLAIHSAWAGVPSNLSIDTDPQQQEAASPLVLVVRSFLR
ncbi:MAG: hypothetical protein A3I66_20605 [Burkholderiales bacterium RIFCSPLOWO2_02_FULL_57_36]|nr:MAG: hypothetical protein A3I66_20605 [Burkholderiales bacterium RIFCSPLOWO2_02_FULL_57_36]